MPFLFSQAFGRFGDFTPAPPSLFEATITIPMGTVSSDLADFPVYVDLADMPASFWSTVKADGGDIRVRAPGSPGSLVPIDVAAIDTGAQTGVLFFKAGSLLAAMDNEWTIEADGVSDALAPDDANGREAVWADYEIVYWAQGGLINRVDGAAAVQDGTINDGSGPPGWLTLAGNGGLRFTAAAHSTTWSFGSRAQCDNVGGSNDSIAGYSTNSSSLSDVAQIAFRGSGSVFGAWNSSDGWASAGSPVSGTPYVVHVRHNGTTRRDLYADGLLVVGDDTIAARPAGGGTTLFVGQWSTATSERMAGAIQFTWLRNDIVSEAWMAAEHGNVADAANFYTITENP